MTIRARVDADHDNGREETPAEAREEAKRAYGAFERLKPNERFIINLRLIEALRYKQIAAMTGFSEEAARKAYDRAICHLQKLYQANGEL